MLCSNTVAVNSVYSLPPCGGGLGWGVTAYSERAVTPLPVPPPQGGRGRCGATRHNISIEFAEPR